MVLPRSKKAKVASRSSPRVTLRTIGTMKFDKTNTLGRHHLVDSTGKEILELVLEMNDASVDDFESIIIQAIKPYECSLDGCYKTVGYVVGDDLLMCKDHMLEAVKGAGAAGLPVRVSPPGEAFTLKLDDPFPEDLLPPLPTAGMKSADLDDDE